MSELFRCRDASQIGTPRLGALGAALLLAFSHVRNWSGRKHLSGKLHREYENLGKITVIETHFLRDLFQKTFMQKFPSTVKQPSQFLIKQKLMLMAWMLRFTDSPVIHMGCRSLSVSSFPCHDLGVVMCTKKSWFLSLIDLIVTNLMSLRWSCYTTAWHNLEVLQDRNMDIHVYIWELEAL